MELFYFSKQTSIFRKRILFNNLWCVPIIKVLTVFSECKIFNGEWILLDEWKVKKYLWIVFPINHTVSLKFFAISITLISQNSPISLVLRLFKAVEFPEGNEASKENDNYNFSREKPHQIDAAWFLEGIIHLSYRASILQDTVACRSPRDTRKFLITECIYQRLRSNSSRSTTFPKFCLEKYILLTIMIW